MVASARGFTLIELSIVLVIIGLIVGGILVGRDLINAAAIRAQITQIEKYQTAVNTFKGKYGYLPGDLKDPEATQFGFDSKGSLTTSRGRDTGTGNGDGVLIPYLGAPGDGNQGPGETLVFWNDLSTAHLIDGSFTTATETDSPASIDIRTDSSPNLNAFFPQAKLGSGNYVYVYSDGSANWFGVGNISMIQCDDLCQLYSMPAFTVAQAAAIDKKMDDGMPASGSVVYQFYNLGLANYNSNPPGPPSSTTCYDNSQTPPRYSLTQNNGAGVNCALSFRFQ